MTRGAMDPRRIALFDSGFGGLTVARAVIDLLPNESIVYLGDTGRYPYGPRPQRDVRSFAIQITRHLIEHEHAQAVIVACNTASAAALTELQSMFDVPVFGVIEPGVRALIDASETGRIGVIGTVGTIASGAYQRAVFRLAPDRELLALPCPGFVEFVERGEFRSPDVHTLAEELLAPAVDAKIDTLLLGCTHYPYLARTISDVMGPDVVLVSSADETAFEVRRQMATAAPSEGVPTHRFLTTGDIEWFTELGGRLLGPELDSAERVTLER